VRLLCVLALAGAWACGDNLGDGVADAGPADARHFADANRAACGPDAGCSGEPLTPVCDEGRGICVECVEESDCDREESLGPRCAEAAGYCQCGADEECADNPNGPWCHAVASACTCIDDGDCTGGRTCEMEPYLGGGVRTCQAAQP
jgi:hypothetical protein